MLWPHQNQLKHLQQASVCSGWSFAQEGYSWKLYLSSIKHDGKKRAFPKANILPLKALLYT